MGHTSARGLRIMQRGLSGLRCRSQCCRTASHRGKRRLPVTRRPVPQGGCLAVLYGPAPCGMWPISRRGSWPRPRVVERHLCNAAWLTTKCGRCGGWRAQLNAEIALDAGTEVTTGARGPVLGCHAREWPYEIAVLRYCAHVSRPRRSNLQSLLEWPLSAVCARGWCLEWVAVRRQLNQEAHKVATASVFWAVRLAEQGTIATRVTGRPMAVRYFVASAARQHGLASCCVGLRGGCGMRHVGLALVTGWRDVVRLGDVLGCLALRMLRVSAQFNQHRFAEKLLVSLHVPGLQLLNSHIKVCMLLHVIWIAPLNFPIRFVIRLATSVASGRCTDSGPVQGSPACQLQWWQLRLSGFTLCPGRQNVRSGTFKNGGVGQLPHMSSFGTSTRLCQSLCWMAMRCCALVAPGSKVGRLSSRTGL